MKRDVVVHLYRLIAPHRGKFLTAVAIALLSTGASLIEPLIYREAVNDIAGLFVKEANDTAKKKSGDIIEESEGALEKLLRREIEKRKLAHQQPRAAGTEQPQPPRELHPPAAPGGAKATGETPRRPAKVHVKRPHTKTHVAERTPSEAIGTLIWAVVILFVANVVGYVLWLISDNMSVRLSCRIEQRFIQGAFAHVLKLPLEFFSKRSSSAIAKQIDQSEEVSGIVTAVSQQILPELISLVGILLIMFWQNARLTLVALAVIPAYLFIAWRSSQRLETGLNTYYERWEEVSGRIQSALSGIKTVKLSGAERREVARYAQISDEAYANYVERSRLSNRYTFWQGVLTHLSTALVLGYGGYLALVHKLTPGDVVMFVSYLDRLYSPIGELTSLWVNLQLNIASISRAFKLLDQNEEEPAGREFVPSRGEIRFENVRFGYTEEREVLKGVSLRFAPGRITAIVGSSGAGKTTTVDLLLKLYDVTSGDISIDGRSILDADPASVRGQIGMVSADSAIFRGTVADNIRYRKADATDGELMDAVRKSGLDGLVNRLPEGLATQVGQNGIGLSVGERQRIQIARVLVSKPGILVLDEATANLDYNTESTIREAVEAMKHDCTIVVIAHRYSMVRNADYVYVLRDGEVIEEGTPGDLIGRNGWFTGFATAAEEDTGTGEESAEPDEISDDELVEETEDA